MNGMEPVPSVETLPHSFSAPVESFLAPGQSYFLPQFAQSPPTSQPQGNSSCYTFRPSLSGPFTPLLFPFGGFSKASCLVYGSLSACCYDCAVRVASVCGNAVVL